MFRRQVKNFSSPKTLQIKPFHTKTSFKMPLVVPGITSGDGENAKTNEWMNKLVGKKLGESSDATVSYSHLETIQS